MAGPGSAGTVEPRFTGPKGERSHARISKGAKAGEVKATGSKLVASKWVSPIWVWGGHSICDYRKKTRGTNQIFPQSANWAAFTMATIAARIAIGSTPQASKTARKSGSFWTKNGKPDGKAASALSPSRWLPSQLQDSLAGLLIRYVGKPASRVRIPISPPRSLPFPSPSNPGLGKGHFVSLD
jgi:hypothetical protein